MTLLEALLDALLYAAVFVPTLWAVLRVLMPVSRTARETYRFFFTHGGSSGDSAGHP